MDPCTTTDRHIITTRDTHLLSISQQVLGRSEAMTGGISCQGKIAVPGCLLSVSIRKLLAEGDGGQKCYSIDALGNAASMHVIAQPESSRPVEGCDSIFQ